MTPSEASLLRKYVERGRAMQIATTDDTGKPWIATCWYAADNELRLVFLSRAGREHSRHIIQRPDVAVYILDLPLEGLGQKVVGVQARGRAAMVDDADLRECYDVYARVYPQVADIITLDTLHERSTENRLWRVSVDQFVYFDEHHFPDEPRRVVDTW